MKKVLIVHIIYLAIVFDMIDEREKKEKNWGEKPKKNHDTNYYDKPVMFQI